MEFQSSLVRRKAKMNLEVQLDEKRTDLPPWEDFLDEDYTIEHRHAGFQTFRGLSHKKALAILMLAFDRGVTGKSTINPSQSKWQSWEICNRSVSTGKPRPLDPETARRLLIDFWDCAQEVLKAR